MVLISELKYNVTSNTAGVEGATPVLEELQKTLKSLDATVKAFGKSFDREMKRSGNATEQLKRPLQQNKKAANDNKKALGGLTSQITDWSKSVQVALGPLSGVASRLTAFASLADRNTLRLAAFTSVIIAWGAALLKAVKIGAEYEKQLLRIDSVLEVTGNRIGLTTTQIDQFSQEVGKATLTTQQAARDASVALLTVVDLPRDLFKNALLAAQGLSLLGRGDIRTSMRRLVRLLQDPASNLKALRESGISFNAVQERLIKNLQEQGDKAGAVRAVFDNLNIVIGIATSQAGSLSDAWDALGENTTTAFQQTGVLGGAVQEVTRTLVIFNNTLEELNSNTTGAIVVGKAFALTVEALSAPFVVAAFGLQKLSESITTLSDAWQDFFSTGTEAKVNVESEGVEKTADELRNFAIGDAQKTLVEFEGQFLKLTTEARSSENQFKRLTKQVLDLDDASRKAALEGLNLTEEELNKIVFILDNKLDTSLGKFIGKLQEENTVLKENVDITGFLGEAKFQLSTQQEVQNKLVESGLVLSRKELELGKTLTDQQKEQAREIARTTKERKELERLAKATEEIVGLRQILELTREEIKLVDQSTVVRERSVAKIRQKQKLLNAGISSTNELWKEQLFLVDEIAKSEIEKFHKEQIKDLRQIVELQERESAILINSSRVRELNVAIAEKEIELAERYGNLLDVRAQKELELFRRTLSNRQVLDDLTDVLDTVEDGFEDIGLTVLDSFSKGEDAMESFRGVAIDVLSDIQREIVKTFITQPLKDAIGRGLGNVINASLSPAGAGGAGAGIGPFQTTVIPGAKGLVMNAGHITRMGKGEVLNGPTLFPMQKGAAMGGEAGPEGVLPLKRNAAGDLGVVVAEMERGGGSQVVVAPQAVSVNIFNENSNNNQVETEQKIDESGGLTIDIFIRQVETQIADNVVNNRGPIPPAFTNSYGLSRSGRV